MIWYNEKNHSQEIEGPHSNIQIIVNHFIINSSIEHALINTPAK